MQIFDEKYTVGQVTSTPPSSMSASRNSNHNNNGRKSPEADETNSPFFPLCKPAKTSNITTSQNKPTATHQVSQCHRPNQPLLPNQPSGKRVLKMQAMDFIQLDKEFEPNFSPNDFSFPSLTQQDKRANYGLLRKDDG